MKRRTFLSTSLSAGTAALFILALASASASAAEQVTISVDGKDLVTYQSAPMSEPEGGDKFQGSNFIHPLKTPSGFVVTDSQPQDHLHHFGVWWPWKFIEHNGRKILCWELQKSDGIVEAREHTPTPHGLLTESVYLDRKAPEGPQIRLKETTRITTSDIIEKPVTGYTLDLEIAHEVEGSAPITINKFRYSGLGFRGSALWDKESSTLLTSEGNTREDTNFTAARWIRVEGTNGKDGTAGVLIMSHPSNHNHPEKLRTWNQQHKGAIFVNYNPVMDEPWTFEPGKTYTRLYRLFIYDGTLTADESQKQWEQFASPSPSPSMTK